MMNSLPRWFGRKKSKDEKKAPLEISEPFAPVHRGGMSSATPSMVSVASLNSLASIAEENENLYVNGRVPRGQFREYFLRPPDHAPVQVYRTGYPDPAAPEHKFLVPRVPGVSRAASTRSVAAIPVAGPGCLVRRSASQRSDVLVSSTFLADRRPGSLMKKSLSMDDVLEESLDRSEESGGAGETSYYNVTRYNRDKTGSVTSVTGSQLVLSKENLKQHDQLYIQKLGSLSSVKSSQGLDPLSSLKTQGPDPLSTSYLGHTLLSQVDDGMEEGEEGDSNTELSGDSGALSMGGVSVSVSVSVSMVRLCQPLDILSLDHS